MSLSTKHRPWPGVPLAIFAQHISHVVELRAEKEMIRPDASRVVAVMEYE